MSGLQSREEVPDVSFSLGEEFNPVETCLARATAEKQIKINAIKKTMLRRMA
jgi:hypothetical protein